MVGPVEVSEETNYPELEIKKSYTENTCSLNQPHKAFADWRKLMLNRQSRPTIAIKIDRNILYYNLMEI